MKLVGHGGAVTTVFVDEGRIYTGSEDEKIRIWDKEVTPMDVTTNYSLVHFYILLILKKPKQKKKKNLVQQNTQYKYL